MHSPDCPSYCSYEDHDDYQDDRCHCGCLCPDVCDRCGKSTAPIPAGDII